MAICLTKRTESGTLLKKDKCVDRDNTPEIALQRAVECCETVRGTEKWLTLEQSAESLVLAT